ncbi:MAG: hypothetical protein ABJZ55_13420 [Fuerstiella sp.]
MDVELLIPLISRWAHIGTAIVLVGGTTFFRFVVMPALGADNPELIEKIRKGWKKFVHTGVAIFIVSGFYNYIKAIPLHKGDGLYHMLVGTKMLLAFFVFFIASALVGHTAGTQKFRDGAKQWTGIMLMVAAIIVGISGFVKIRGLPVKPVDPAAEVSGEAESIGVPSAAFDDEFATQ